MSDPDLRLADLYPDGTAADIVAMLRKSADAIEAEDGECNRTVAIVAVQIFDDGRPFVYGWGRVDRLQAAGALALGLHEVAC